MRHRRIFLALVIVVSGLLAASYLVLTRTGLSRTIVESVLARVLRRVQLDNAELDPTSGRVTLRNLQIGHPRREGPLARADHVQLDVDTNPLGAVGAVRAVEIEALDLELDFTQDPPLDLSEVLAERSELGEAKDFPAILIRDSTVRLRLAPGAPALALEAVQLQLLPEAEARSSYALQGTSRSRHGLSITIRGRGDAETGALQVVAEATGVELHPGLAESFGAAAQQWLERASFHARSTRLALWANVPGRGGGTPIAGVHVRFEDLACAPPEIPYRLQGATGVIEASTEDDGTIRVEAQREDAGGRLEASGRVLGCFTSSPLVDLRLVGRDIPVDAALREAVRQHPEGEEIWDAFEPEGGRVDADLQLKNEVAGGVVRLGLDLDLRGVSACFRGLRAADGSLVCFPYAVHELEGRIQVRPGGSIAVHGLQGRRPDGGRFTVRIALSRDESSGQPVNHIAVEARDALASNELRDALAALLPGEGLEYWQTYAPSGRLDADVFVDRNGPQPPVVRVELRPLAMGASYAHCPYPLTDLRGTVAIGNDGVAFDLTGRRQVSRLHLEGRFLRQAGDTRLGAELLVEAEDLSFDEQMGAALLHLSPDLGKPWDYLSPSGLADCGLCLWREPGREAFVYDLRVDLKGASIQPADFRMQLGELHGPVFVHGEGNRAEVEVSAVRGAVDNRPGVPPARLLAQGEIKASSTAPLQTDLNVVVRSLELTNDVRDALDDRGILERDTWDLLRPSGFVDVVLRLAYAPFGPPQHLARVWLREVGSRAAVLPGPAAGLRGELVVAEEAVRFEELRGTVDGHEVTLHSGSVATGAAGTRCRVTVNANGFPLDDDFGNLLSGPLRTAYLQRAMRGRIDFDDLKLEFWFPRGQRDFTTWLQGRVAVHDVDLVLGAPVRGLTGACVLHEGRISAEGNRIAGELARVSLRVLGHQVEELQSSFLADEREVEFTQSSLRLHGGRVEQGEARRGGAAQPAPALQYWLDGSERIAMNVRWRGIGLREFVRATGRQELSLWGSVDGQLDLQELFGSELVTMRGSLRLAIANAFLGEVPMFRAIFAILEPRQRPRFDSLQLAADIADGVAKVTHLHLASPIVTVEGSGHLGLDGYVDLVLTFPKLFGRPGELLILPSMLHALTAELVRIHLYGWLRNTQARTRLRWQDNPGRAPLGPLPAAGERRG